MCAGNIAKAAGMGARTAENGYIKAVEKTSAVGAAGKLAAMGGAAAVLADKVGSTKGPAPESVSKTLAPSPVANTRDALRPSDEEAYRTFYEKQRAERGAALAELDAAIAAQEAMVKKATSKGANGNK